MTRYKPAIFATVSMLLIAAMPAAAQSFKDLKSQAKAQASSQLSAKLGIPSPAPAGAAAYIISPKNGDTVSSPVKVVFGLTGMGVSPPGSDIPKTGHHVLLIDSPTVDYTVALPASSDQLQHFDGGETETSLSLKPGSHTLQLLVADWKQQAFNPSVQSDKITITVK